MFPLLERGDSKHHHIPTLFVGFFSHVHMIEVLHGVLYPQADINVFFFKRL